MKFSLFTRPAVLLHIRFFKLLVNGYLLLIITGFNLIGISHAAVSRAVDSIEWNSVEVNIKENSLQTFELAMADDSKSQTQQYPLIRESRNPKMQQQLQQIIKELNLAKLVKEKRIGIALVDITNELNPVFAGVNGYSMMYAASLPKIAILFGLFKRIEEGTLVLDEETHALAHAMIRSSSNTAATNLVNLVGFDYLAKLLQSKQYRLYEETRGGGLWVGKVYGKDEAWKRDPLNHLSHGASPIKVARFYYLLETNRLVNPGLTEQMKAILVDPAINHKFVKGLNEVCPEAKIYRKSGTWRDWHSDSAIVTHGGKKYIAVVLIKDEKGGELLPKLIKRFEKIIFSGQPLTGCEDYAGQ